MKLFLVALVVLLLLTYTPGKMDHFRERGLEIGTLIVKS